MRLRKGIRIFEARRLHRPDCMGDVPPPSGSPPGTGDNSPGGLAPDRRRERRQDSRIPGGLLTCALLVVILWGISAARPFLVPVSISALLAFLMAPLVRALARLRVPEIVASLVAALVLLLPIFALGFMVIEQGESLVRNFPSIIHSVNGSFSRFAASPVGRRLNIEESQGPSALVARFTGDAEKGVSFVVSGLSTLLDATSELTLIIIFSVVMLASRAHLRASTERIIAMAESIEAPALLDEVTLLIQRFLVARMLIVLIVSMLAVATLKAFGIDYGFLLGIFDGVMTLVPAIGVLIALVPIVIVTLATGHSLLALVVLLGILLAISFFEGNILTPKLVGRRLNVNTLASFLGFLAGGLLWGAWGMFLSVPVLGVLRIVFSAIPRLQPWGDLLAEREDRGQALHLSRRRGPGRPSEP